MSTVIVATKIGHATLGTGLARLEGQALGGRAGAPGVLLAAGWLFAVAVAPVDAGESPQAAQAAPVAPTGEGLDKAARAGAAMAPELERLYRYFEELAGG